MTHNSSDSKEMEGKANFLLTFDYQWPNFISEYTAIGLLFILPKRVYAYRYLNIYIFYFSLKSCTVQFSIFFILNNVFWGLFNFRTYRFVLSRGCLLIYYIMYQAVFNQSLTDRLSLVSFLNNVLLILNK